MPKKLIPGSCAILLLVSSCQSDPMAPQAKANQQVYDYQVDVEETAMSVPLTIFSVKTGVSVSYVYRGNGPAYLFIYSRIYSVKAPKENVFPRVRQIPQDTLTIALTRPQTDIIYALVRRIFELPPQAALRDSAHPPVYAQLHDTDPYLRVRFHPNAYDGPAYECTGYEENNGASYALHDYLLTLQRRHLKQK